MNRFWNKERAGREKGGEKKGRRKEEEKKGKIKKQVLGVARRRRRPHPKNQKRSAFLARGWGGEKAENPWSIHKTFGQFEKPLAPRGLFKR